MEEKIEITLRDTKYILNGTLRKTKGAKDLCVFVHGFLENQHEHIFYNGSRYLSEYCYDSFRFDLYDCTKESRHFQSSTIANNANDVDDVLEYFSGKYSKIHIVGHSLGCVAILISDLSKVASIIFWDPSRHPVEIFESAVYCSELGAYLMESRVRFLIGKRMIIESKQIPKVSELLKRIKVPIKIITAGKAGMAIGKKIYFNQANNPKAFHNINNGDHGFNHAEVESVLFKETLEWLRRN